MACILINDEVQSTLTMKDLEKAIRYIFSTEEKQIIISPEGGIGYIYLVKSMLKEIFQNL
ncbi:hypothetical protein KNV35_gp63 [uncultured phage cr8_1]|uniref:Uncharacterized protein n=1 Tax=uncultured phage cr8_1 TaxID=2772068 RepID=A0A7M1RY94_9CAUD|nr:hypothetical protein KNV35_gp63 [uncultured phage cr8_1]QOR58872.1 hypothetical protein [uncultured phage cr8_1]